MKKYILLLLLAVITMNYQACQPKNDRIADLKDFVEEIAEDGQRTTPANSGRRPMKSSLNCWTKSIPTTT